MTILSTKNYSITTMYNLVTGDRPVSEGVQICRKCDYRDDSYYAIATIKYDENEHDTKIELYGSLLFTDVETQEFPLVKRLVEIAERMVMVTKGYDWTVEGECGCERN